MNIPSAAWQRRLDLLPEQPGRPAFWALGSLIRLVPTYFRLRATLARDRKMGRESMLVSFDPRRAGPIQGVPLGGIGGGTVTRGWRGDFARWQLQPGCYRYGAVPADQFSVAVKRDGKPVQARVLYPGRPAQSVLGSWNWGMDGACATYHALFPRAWTIYENPVPGVRLTCRQVSPVIPHDYRASSLPAGVFAWTVENTGAEPAMVSLMMTFQNGIGAQNDLDGGHLNRRFHLESEEGPILGKEEPILGKEGPIVGVSLVHANGQMGLRTPGRGALPTARYNDPLSFAIAARERPGIHVSSRACFSASGDGSDVWEAFSRRAQLEEDADGAPSPAGTAVGAALAATLNIPAGERREVEFALSWDMPLARFGEGRAWYRRYTRWYGREGEAAPRLACDALRDYPEWEKRIAAWQTPVLDDTSIPDWYKSALFNELYYVVDGGTVWTDGEEGQPAPAEEDVGHFAYLEGHEYRMFNTYDVHFYASFALAMLWPLLELSLQRDFARALQIEHPELRAVWFSGARVPRKVRGAIPHDLGAPGEDPWYKVNAYMMQDTGRWKDLNPKFVLQVCRDWAATGDRAFLDEMWPAVRQAMRFMEQFDTDGDGLIENEGIPDQTYDTWSVRGPSAYSAGLWLASLSAAAALGDAVGDAETSGEFRARLARGQAAYESKLWNGASYNYDGSGSRHHDSIMADQLAGPWYARACGLPPVVPEAHARRTLATIFAFNVMKHRAGRMGAVNGMRPSGMVDTSDQQSQEVWTGTTYALAACMLQEGMREEAFKTAQGVYRMGWEELGYWFQTPEAWKGDGNYRALAYMRPLAVWAMEWARTKLPAVPR